MLLLNLFPNFIIMIYVIGSSFSSLATVLTLIKYNIDVTVIDVGKKNNNTKQKHIKNLMFKELDNIN